MAKEPATRGGKLAIGDLARRSGCGIDTIRYYERIGLMPTVERTEGGHRLYEGDHMRRLAFIRRSRTLGLSLDQICDILGSAERSAYGCEEMRTLLTRSVTVIRSQIKELQKIEANLLTTIDKCGDAELSNCRVIEAMLAGDEGMADPCCCS